LRAEGSGFRVQSLGLRVETQKSDERLDVIGLVDERGCREAPAVPSWEGGARLVHACLPACVRQQVTNPPKGYQHRAREKHACLPAREKEREREARERRAREARKKQQVTRKGGARLVHACLPARAGQQVTNPLTCHEPRESEREREQEKEARERGERERRDKEAKER